MEEPTLRNLTNPNYRSPSKNQNLLLQELGLPHVSSFNYMLDSGLDVAVKNLLPVEFRTPNGDLFVVRIVDANVCYPSVPLGTIGTKTQNIFPTECRQRAGTYCARLMAQIAWSLNGKEQPAFEKNLGDIPIMLKSNRCHLAHMTPEQLVKHNEHEDEWGGYFLIKGNEKLIRMLLMTRRNYPIAIRRSGWRARGELFSDTGVSMRCVTDDQTVTTNVLHFVTDGSAKLMFGYRKVLYYAPLMLILKCLLNCSDYVIYQQLIAGYEDDLYYSSCVQNMLRALHSEDLHTQEECKAHLGKMFRIKFYDCPERYTDIDVTDFILKTCVMIHVPRNEDKFNALIFMTKKLFVFVQNKCKNEGADAVMMQELLLSGHLYLQVLKDRLQMWLVTLKLTILKRIRTSAKYGTSLNDIILAAKNSGTIEASMQNFLATGNIKSQSGLGLMQDTGLAILAENINRMRYMSHFKAVHRGAFFQEMRTTDVRQLLPDAWGFICPVHTPDGAPCGLLNHLTMNCQVTTVPDPNKLLNIPKVLKQLGMIGLNYAVQPDLKESYPTVLDGRFLGYVPQGIADKVVAQLRVYKIKDESIPFTTEIVLVPIKHVVGQFPGLYLFTGPARMMRPVVHLATRQMEMIGTFEQVYLNVCIVAEEIYPGVTTHMELSKTAFLSNIAQLIPMPDCNQSPRNMYQCQMGKQTMGTPLHTWKTQADTKAYRLQTPATPLFRPAHYDNIKLDDYPMGTNAIVAVISYTGYDMEDAMIINKSSYERGFAHGSIYKSEFITLDDADSYFCRDPTNEDLEKYLDTDGLPYHGAKIVLGTPLYCFFNSDQSKYVVKKHSSKEEYVVDNVRLCGGFMRVFKTACLTFRIARNPSVGDKFASRAGQKGICSQKWPAEDLPFTETGLVPDIVFNPHGFPSRMTIAMMIEVMAGKSASIHGLVHDATPFRFGEEDTAIDYFGRLLEAGGYNYYGTETMYSGIDGREMTVQIFFGVVHYQRLRHMVSDKWQVRSTGPVDILTHQPLKGRRRGGGVRFGEMERDSLISHGASFLLQDRLLHCSDETTVFICTGCSTLLGPITVVTRKNDLAYMSETKEYCRLCENGDKITQIQIPYIFKFLVTQLASVNIKIKIECENV